VVRWALVVQPLLPSGLLAGSLRGTFGLVGTGERRQRVVDDGRGVGPGGRGVYLDFAEAIGQYGQKTIAERYGNLFEMYQRITGESAYSQPKRIYPAVHYTMGGLWVDYNLMGTVPGLFVIGEANFSDHGANRLGASALMQGLCDGYFVLPYTIGNYLAGAKLDKDYRERRISQRVEIGHDVWIGHGAIILPGVKIGHGAVVAAGASVEAGLELAVVGAVAGAIGGAVVGAVVSVVAAVATVVDTNTSSSVPHAVMDSSRRVAGMPTRATRVLMSRHRTAAPA
jgi:acetyltransferase-like isoleucine patch superfamily enzyme